MTDFKKLLIINLSITLTLIVVLLTTTWWLSYDINKRIGTIQDARKEQSFQSQAIESLASLKKDSQQAAVEKLSLNNFLPIQDQLIDFPRDINNFAKQYGVAMEFAFGQEVKSDGAQPGNIKFTMTARASFDNLINFFRAIESSHYFVGFDSFNLVRDNQEFKSVISGRVFFQ